MRRDVRGEGFHEGFGGGGIELQIGGAGDAIQFSAGFVGGEAAEFDHVGDRCEEFAGAFGFCFVFAFEIPAGGFEDQGYAGGGVFYISFEDAGRLDRQRLPAFVVFVAEACGASAASAPVTKISRSEANSDMARASSMIAAREVSAASYCSDSSRQRHIAPGIAFGCSSPARGTGRREESRCVLRERGTGRESCRSEIFEDRADDSAGHVLAKALHRGLAFVEILPRA